MEELQTALLSIPLPHYSHAKSIQYASLIY
jgi:hypothetical protein